MLPSEFGNTTQKPTSTHLDQLPSLLPEQKRNNTLAKDFCFFSFSPLCLFSLVQTERLREASGAFLTIYHINVSLITLHFLSGAEHLKILPSFTCRLFNGRVVPTARDLGFHAIAIVMMAVSSFILFFQLIFDGDYMISGGMACALMNAISFHLWVIFLQSSSQLF